MWKQKAKIYAARAGIGLCIYAIAMLLKWKLGWGWHVGMIAAFIGSVAHWRYYEKVPDWEKRAAFSTLAYMPVQYAFFIGTTGELSYNQTYELLLVFLFFKGWAIVDLHEDKVDRV